MLEVQSDGIVASPIKVLLVDDEAVIRAGLRVLIDSWSPFQVVGEADTSAEALAAVETVQPNLILCSHKGRSNGIADAIGNLKKGAADIPIVLLTGSRHPETGSRAVEAGAKWIVWTKEAAIELRRALEKVISGEWMDELSLALRSTKKRNNRRSHVERTNGDRLSNRERDV